MRFVVLIAVAAGIVLQERAALQVNTSLEVGLETKLQFVRQTPWYFISL